VPTARVSDPYVTVAYGRHHALLLADGKGRPELDDALDPLPSRSGLRPVSPGDPFENRERPLYFAIASDCASLPKASLRSLVCLGRLPGVRVDLMPGVPDLGADAVHRVSWSADGDPYTVTTTRQPETQWFAKAESALFSLAEEVLAIDAEAAMRMVLEAESFEALGYDYLVSPVLASTRGRDRRAWPNRLGAVTIEEALRLAGSKARMYGSVPVEHDSNVRVSTTIGAIYDMAVLRFVPGLKAALAGAVGSTDPTQTAAVPYLLGIRARLNQLLLARDEVYRLTRREALGSRHGRPVDEAHAPGRAGNDLTEALAYHMVAALDASYAAGDALAWVAASRDEYSGSGSRVGLTLLKRNEGDPAKGLAAGAVRGAVTGASSSPFLWAARELRNRSAHRDGLDYGHLAFDPPASDPREPSVIWVTPDTFLGHMDATELYRAVAYRANYADGDLAVLTFVRLVDELWCATAATMSRGVRALRWSDWRWTRSDPRWGRDTSRLWWTRTQRGLWGIGRGADDGREGRDAVITHEGPVLPG
jgi:hypothetical protein